MSKDKSYFKCTCLSPYCLFEKAVNERWNLSRKLQIKIEDLELTMPVINCCKTVGIRIVRDFILQSEEELRYDGFSYNAIKKVRDALTKLDLSMGMKLPE